MDCRDMYKMIVDRKMVLIGIGLGLAFWIIEAAIHAYIFFHNSFITEIFTPDPHEVWMRLVVGCLFVLFGFYAQFIINQRNQAKERANESENRLLTILDTVQAGIIIIDLETRFIVDANKAAVEMIGTSRDLIVGRKCHNFLCPTEQGNCPIADHGQPMDNADRILLTAQGKETPILKTVITVRLSGREHLLESFLDISDRKRAEKEREKLIGELQEALAEVKTLSGLLPICSSCKKIRDDKGYWSQIETYIGEHSEAEFSHSICPECVKKLYPGLGSNKSNPDKL